MKGKLTQLHDVSLGDPEDGSVLTYNGDEGVWEAGEGGGGDLALADLTDVSGSPADGDVLTYDGSGWVPETPATPSSTLTYWEGAVSGSLSLTTTSTQIPGLITSTLEAGTYLVIASVLFKYDIGDVGNRVRMWLHWGSSDAFICFFDSAAAHDEIVLFGHRVVTLSSAGTIHIESRKDSATGGTSSVPSNSQSRMTVIKIA